jgi:hypothetical protein
MNAEYQQDDGIIRNRRVGIRLLVKKNLMIVIGKYAHPRAHLSHPNTNVRLIVNNNEMLE